MLKKTIYIFLLLLLPASIYSQNLPDKGICAHRGASLTQPENTKTSIAEAVRLGAQMIEFDVRKTEDNKLVIIHDASVDRTTNGKGKISDLTLSEISKLDAGKWKGEKFKNEKIPTLEEILEIIPDTIWMNIHIKGNPETAKAVAELITSRNQTMNAVLAVKNEAVTVVKSINEKIKICCMERGKSSADYVKNALEVNANFIQLTEREYPVLNKIIPELKKNNIKINYFYSDSIKKMEILYEEGVDFVLSNNVEELLKEFQKRN